LAVSGIQSSLGVAKRIELKAMVDKFKNLKSKLGKWFWVILVITLIVIWRVIAGSNKTTKVQTVKVSQGDLVQSVSTSGTVKADQYSQLTFPAGGKIAGVFVKSGDKVGKGAWIAQLDTVPLNAAYQQALGNYRNYQAQAEQALDSVKGHSGDETFAQKVTRTTAEVNRDNAYNAMLAAQDNLANAVITAPFSGVMDTVSPSSPGMQVVAASANYTIVNPATVYFDSEVEESDLPNVSVGQKVNIKLDAYPDETFQGLVVNVGLVAFTSSTGGNAYHVRISLPKNDNLKFRVGMQGDVDIIYNTIPNVLKVSSSAVVADGGKSYVWGIEGGKSKKINIETGKSSTDETEVKSGLSSGQEVIDNPASNFAASTKVTASN
jgi:RND family efflux transporter MFP subunit